MRRWFTFFVPLLIIVMVIASCSPRKVPSQPTQSNPAPTPVSTEPVVPSQSNQLIDEALNKGEIDAQTALVYKVYAQFSDSRLPEKFKGGVDVNTDSHILDEIEAQYASLSPENQAIVLPFLVPPVYQGAWGPPAEGSSGGVTTIEPPCSKIETDKWDSTSAMHSTVRIWWLKSRPEDAVIANKFMTAMDDEIWPKLTTVMGRTPMADEGAQCNGGGPEMDIYITPQIARSYAASYFPPGCRETPSYIVMNPAVSDAILAHEFMHAIQWSYNTSVDCMYPGDYAWMAEATASWAQDYVYPDSNEEHGYIPWFYAGGSGGQPPVLNLRNDKHEYGANIFFFYLTHHFDDPGIVKTAWDNTTSMNSLDAVDKSIPGGLDAVWADFAVNNMVEPPYDDYQKWDQLNVKPDSTSLTVGEATGNNTYIVTKEIDHLSIQYVWFTFKEDARLVTYFNGITYELDDEPMDEYMGTVPINDGTLKYKFTAAPADDVKGVKVQAFYKIAGDTEWQIEDWTDKPYMSFCRDAGKEKLTDLVIITSNSSQDNDVVTPGNYNSLLQTSDIGCWRYGGSASLTFTGAGDAGGFTDEQQLPNVAFERTEEHPNIPYPFLHFKIAEGQVNRTYDYQGEDCTGSGESSDALSPAPQYGFGNDLYILYGAVSGNSVRRYAGQANADKNVTVNFTCKDGSTSQGVPSQPWFYVDVLSQIPADKVFSVATGGTLDGSGDLLQDTDNATMQFEWHFVTLAEPAGAGGDQANTGSTDAPAGGTSSSSGGGAPQSPSDAGFPDVPDYPNVESSSLVSGSGMFIMITPDSKDDVVAFYRDQLTAQGWTDVSNPGSSTEEMLILMFIKGTKAINLMIASQDDKTQVMIYEAGQ